MKRALSSVILFILIIQIATITLAVEIEREETKQEENELTTIKADNENEEEDDDEDDDSYVDENENEDVWTDFSKATVTIETDTEGAKQYAYYRVKVSGVTLKDTGCWYRMIITHSSTKPEVKYDDKLEYYIDATTMKSNTDINNYLEENGDIYCHIIEQNLQAKDTKLVFSKKLERPTQNKLHDRLLCFFFEEETSSFYYGPRDNSLERKINLKIGTINDNNILLSMKNGDKDCLDKLLAYTKTAESIYTGVIPLGKSTSITKNLKLVHKGYYYVYMQLDDENGKYYPVEDVSLYQACIGESIGTNLWDYLDSSFTWNIENGSGGASNIDPTTAGTKYPYTGKIAIGTGIVALIGATYVLYRKNKKYNDI